MQLETLRKLRRPVFADSFNIQTLRCGIGLFSVHKSRNRISQKRLKIVKFPGRRIHPKTKGPNFPPLPPLPAFQIVSQQLGSSMDKFNYTREKLTWHGAKRSEVFVRLFAVYDTLPLFEVIQVKIKSNHCNHGVSLVGFLCTRTPEKSKATEPLLQKVGNIARIPVSYACVKFSAILWQIKVMFEFRSCQWRISFSAAMMTCAAATNARTYLFTTYISGSW